MSNNAEGKGRSPLARADWGKIFPFLRWKHLINRRTTRADIMAGITGALKRLDPERCRVCRARIFMECSQMPKEREVGPLSLPKGPATSGPKEDKNGKDAARCLFCDHIYYITLCIY